MLKERIEFIDGTGRRVEIQFGDKLEYRQAVYTFGKKIKDTSCDKV